MYVLVIPLIRYTQISLSITVSIVSHAPNNKYVCPYVYNGGLLIEAHGGMHWPGMTLERKPMVTTYYNAALFPICTSALSVKQSYI